MHLLSYLGELAAELASELLAWLVRAGVLPDVDAVPDVDVDADAGSVGP